MEIACLFFIKTRFRNVSDTVQYRQGPPLSTGRSRVGCCTYNVHSLLLPVSACQFLRYIFKQTLRYLGPQSLMQTTYQEPDGKVR